MDDEYCVRGATDEWRALDSVGDAAGWEAALAAMVIEEAQLKARGAWRSGGKTLLHALGVHHDEVRLCAGLAWMLTPDGWHGLGTTLLRALLVDLGLTDLDEADLASAAVVTEELSADGSTRADIVIRLPRSARTVLIEAKVWAGEGETQCARLAERWQHDAPKLVFITRSGGMPTTARTGDVWTPVTWQRVGQLMRELATSGECSAGATEFMHTIETYGGPNA